LVFYSIGNYNFLAALDFNDFHIKKSQGLPQLLLLMILRKAEATRKFLSYAAPVFLKRI